MPRPKRGSVVVEKATRRLDGIKSISANLDFGNGLSVVGYQSKIQELQAQLSDYNTMLSDLDEAMGLIERSEQELRSYSEKMLMGVVTMYGKDSLQYVQAGGKPRRRTIRRTTNLNGVATVSN